jgi:prepilin-type N-terminal cleavage/methylation domain-containing protein
MHKYSKQFGFTLFEFIIVIVLLGILVAGASNLLSVGFGSYFSEKDIVNANSQASVAIERMTRDLRAVGSTTDITTASANEIIIKDLDGNTIDYEISGTQLLRNTQALADGVQSIGFAYYKGDSTLLTPLPLTSTLRQQIRYVVITLNISYNNITFPITTAINLWNLK